MTSNRNEKSIFNLEVTRKEILVRALRPKRKTLFMIFLALLLVALAVIAYTRQELRDGCFKVALGLIELALSVITASGSDS